MSELNDDLVQVHFNQHQGEWGGVLHDSPVAMWRVQTPVHEAPVEDHDDEVIDCDQLEKGRNDFPQVEG